MSLIRDCAPCSIRPTSCQRVAPAQVGKAGEISVVRIHVRVVFECECRKLNVCREVAAGPDSAQEAEGNLNMPRARDEVADVGLAEPRGYISRGRIDRQRRRQHRGFVAIRMNPKMAGEARPISAGS